jgi:hypothetical protein
VTPESLSLKAKGIPHHARLAPSLLNSVGEATMPGARLATKWMIAWTVFVVSAGIARLGSAADRQDREPAVTIQIHDYAHVPGTPLARAVAVVRRFYQKIGVRTDWLSALQPGVRHSLRTTGRIATLTVIILTPDMAARGAIPNAVVGYAAVPHEAVEGIGHIAFVIYDRLLQLANDSAADDMELLGVVMAHEIGHLLLPAGSHVEQGLMRGHWNHEDFRHLDRLDLEFSQTQAEQIRTMLSPESTAAQ